MEPVTDFDLVNSRVDFLKGAMSRLAGATHLSTLHKIRLLEELQGHANTLICNLIGTHLQGEPPCPRPASGSASSSSSAGSSASTPSS